MADSAAAVQLERLLAFDELKKKEKHVSIRKAIARVVSRTGMQEEWNAKLMC